MASGKGGETDSNTLPKEITVKYDLLAHMGEGGMGRVYKVRHRLLDQIQVVKVMRVDVNGDDLKERFSREARLAAQFRHPNMASVLDFDISKSGLAYIVMEFIDGVDLRELLTRTGHALSPDFAIEIGCQVLAALGAMHAKGFVHRDVSPDNVMLTRGEAGEPRIKLIDLGIAKSLMEATGGGLTSADGFVGKVHYASPEHFGGRTGNEKVDRRSDIYSLGVMLYELLTNTEPITGSDYASIITGHLTRQPRDFHETDPDNKVSPLLRAAVLRALEKEPEHRYQTTEDFAAALRPARKAATVEYQSEEIPRTIFVDAPDQVPESDLPATVGGLQAFIRKFPDSPRVNEARHAIERILQSEREDAAWAFAAKTNTAAAWDRFISSFPASARIEAARAAAALARSPRGADVADAFPKTLAEVPNPVTSRVPRVQPPVTPKRVTTRQALIGASSLVAVMIAIAIGGVLLKRSRNSAYTQSGVANSNRPDSDLPDRLSLGPDTIALERAPEPVPAVATAPALTTAATASVATASVASPPLAPAPRTPTIASPQPATELAAPRPVAEVKKTEASPAPAAAAPQPAIAQYVEGGDPFANQRAIEALRAAFADVHRIAIDGGGDVGELMRALQRAKPSLEFSSQHPQITITYTGNVEKLGRLKKRRSAEASVRRNGVVVFAYRLPPTEYRIGRGPADAFAAVLKRALVN